MQNRKKVWRKQIDGMAKRSSVRKLMKEAVWVEVYRF